MKLVRARAHARVGLLGNPSDGYFGKTIATPLRNFSAQVCIYEWPELEIILSRDDRCLFETIEELVDDVEQHGLYGGLRLVKAAIKRFAQHCFERGLELPRQNFSMRYETNIPRQVGLAGSSAIVTAVFRGLMEFYDVEIPLEVLPSLVLRVETEDIGIQAGLQDRVCQTYESLVFMDFERELMEREGRGRYEVLDESLLPPLYVAYRSDLSAISGVYHSSLRALWERGDERVVSAMREIAALAAEGRDCLLRRDTKRFAELMNRNFDLRSSMTTLHPANAAMVRKARALGASAKYAGSGGAIVGVCEDDELYRRLETEFATMGCTVIRPV